MSIALPGAILDVDEDLAIRITIFLNMDACTGPSTKQSKGYFRRAVDQKSPSE